MPESYRIRCTHLHQTYKVFFCIAHIKETQVVYNEEIHAGSYWVSAQDLRLETQFLPTNQLMLSDLCDDLDSHLQTLPDYFIYTVCKRLGNTRLYSFHPFLLLQTC